MKAVTDERLETRPTSQRGQGRPGTPLAGHRLYPGKAMAAALLATLLLAAVWGGTARAAASGPALPVGGTSSLDTGPIERLLAAADEEADPGDEDLLDNEEFEDEEFEDEEALEEIPEEDDDVDAFSVLITEIRFEGNTVIDTETLRKATAALLNKELTLEEMGQGADLVTLAYQEQGYILARGYLPEQEIADGVLRIAVAEGRIGKITVAGNRYYSPEVVKRYFSRQAEHGIVRESLLEKAILMTNEMPDLKTSVVLKEGEKPGEVDVVLNAEEDPGLTLGMGLSFDYNNFGSPLVAENRLGTTVRLVEHRWGSRLSLRGVSGDNPDDSYLVTGTYSLPVNRFGTEVSAHFLKGNYAVGQNFADLGLGGFTTIGGLKARHPIWKKKDTSLNFVVGWDRKEQENEFENEAGLDELQSLDRLDTVSLAVSFDSLDRFLGKNILSVGYHLGNLDTEGEEPNSRAAVDGTFHRLVMYGARIQKLSAYTNVMVRASVQYTHDRLVPMEQAIAGGYGTVRGHPASYRLGDSMYNVSAEVMFAPPFVGDMPLFGQRVAQLMQLAVFYDMARVFTNEPLPGEIDSDRLSGWGGGIRLFYRDMFNFKYDFGIPVNSREGNPELINYFYCSINLF